MKSYTKITAISTFGTNGKSEFYNSNGSLIYFSDLKKSMDVSCAKLFNKEKILISCVKYIDSRNILATKYNLQVNGKEFLFQDIEGNGNLRCKDNNFYLKRGFFDKGFTLYSKEEKIMKVGTHNIFRDYLKAKYTIDINNTKSEGEINFLISVCLIYFILVYETATYSQGKNMGNFWLK